MSTKKETSYENRRQWMKLGLGAASIVTLGATSSAEAAKPKTPFQLEPTYIPIANSSEQFPVRRIYCIGRNYAAHAREMGSDPTREPPFFFQKPTDAIQFVAPNKIVDHPYPTLTKNYHYEVELVAALKTGGKNITIDKALDHVYGYALGLDMTRRDLQRFMAIKRNPGKSVNRLIIRHPSAPFFQSAKLVIKRVAPLLYRLMAKFVKRQT